MLKRLSLRSRCGNNVCACPTGRWGIRLVLESLKLYMEFRSHLQRCATKSYEKSGKRRWCTESMDALHSGLVGSRREKTIRKRKT